MTITKGAYLASIADAIENGASAHPKLDSLKPLPMTAKTGKKDLAAAIAAAKKNDGPDANDELLTQAVRPSAIADELGQGEYIKKADLADMGPFNIVSVSKRTNLTYNGRPSADQYTFEIQLLTGDNKGARALCSFDVNIVRDKIARAVTKHGAVGPFTLEKRNNAFIFVAEGVNDATDSATETDELGF